MFPKMCGRDFDYGRPFFTAAKTAKRGLCSFEIYESFATVKNIVDFWENDLGRVISAGDVETTDVHMGVFKVTNSDTKTKVSDHQVKYSAMGMKLQMPKINALVGENKEAKTQANKIFKKETEEIKSYYEMLHEESQYVRFTNTAGDAKYEMSMNSMIGYRIPSDPAEPVYLGALFGNILDDATIKADTISKIANFFTYTALDENRLPTGTTRAVTCETTGLIGALPVTVNTYEFEAATYDRADLDSYKVNDADTDFKEFKSDEPEVYGRYPSDKDGSSVISCMAATKFDKDNAPASVLVEVSAEITLTDNSVAVLKPKQFNLKLRAPAEKIPETDV